jgi:hypothetical protein
MMRTQPENSPGVKISQRVDATLNVMRWRSWLLDFSSGRSLLQHLRFLVMFEILMTVLILVFGLWDERGGEIVAVMGAALCLICIWLRFRLVTRYVVHEHDREEQLAEAARIEGAALATRTVRHHVGNKLAAAVGYSELLADDPRLPQDLEVHAHKIMASAMAAAETIDKLQRPIVRVQLDTSVHGPPLLDIDSCSTVEPAVVGSRDTNEAVGAGR